MAMASPSQLLVVVTVIFYLLIVTVVCARSTCACGWFTEPAANCPMISTVAFRTSCATDRASSLWFMGKVTQGSLKSSLLSH